MPRAPCARTRGVQGCAPPPPWRKPGFRSREAIPAIRMLPSGIRIARFCLLRRCCCVRRRSLLGGVGSRGKISTPRWGGDGVGRGAGSAHNCRAAAEDSAWPVRTEQVNRRFPPWKTKPASGTLYAKRRCRLRRLPGAPSRLSSVRRCSVRPRLSSRPRDTQFVSPAPWSTRRAGRRGAPSAGCWSSPPGERREGSARPAVRAVGMPGAFRFLIGHTSSGRKDSRTPPARNSRDSLSSTSFHLSRCCSCPHPRRGLT